MKDTALSSIKEVKKFMKSSRKVEFRRENREEAYCWMEKTLEKFGYCQLRKEDKGIMKRYLTKVTGYSRAQITRFIAQYKETGKIRELGVSCPGTPTEEMIRWAMLCKNRHFVSIEPLMEEPYLDWLEFMNWVIVGGLTPKPKHKAEWVERIVYQCINDRVPVFVKDNAYFRSASYQQFPEGMEK